MTAYRPDLTNAAWHKSSRSSSTGQNCVEVAASLPGIVAVRDSKNPDGGALRFRPDEWKTFIAKIQTRALGLVRQAGSRCNPGTIAARGPKQAVKDHKNH